MGDKTSFIRPGHIYDQSDSPFPVLVYQLYEYARKTRKSTWQAIELVGDPHSLKLEESLVSRIY